MAEHHVGKRRVALHADEDFERGATGHQARGVALGLRRCDAAMAARGKNRRVAAFGEMVALLLAEGKPEAAIRLEQLWNDLAKTHSFDLHCAYPMSLFRHAEDEAAIGEICATHSQVIPAESYTSLSNDEERFRAVAILQQKAQALQTQIEEKQRILGLVTKDLAALAAKHF